MFSDHTPLFDGSHPRPKRFPSPTEGFPHDFFSGRSEVKGFAIDGPQTRDRDDLIYYRRDGVSHLASISIADVASIIIPESSLDRRASAQGVTHYFSNGNRPMFPRAFAEGLMSLHEGELRPTVTIHLPFSSTYKPGTPVFELTFCRSEKNLTYSTAESTLRGKGEFREQLLGLRDVATSLFEHRRAAGALAFFDARRGVISTEDGYLQRMNPETVTSHFIIQELMIASNTAVAEHFRTHSIPALFRNHTANHAGQREVILHELSQSHDFEDVELRRLFSTLNPAYYHPDNVGHFALAVPAYLHFTSPIRRYADLINMRILKSSLFSEENPYSYDKLVVLGSHLTEVARSIKKQQEESHKNRALEVGLSAIEPTQLALLPSNAFTARLNYDSSKGDPSQELECEIIRRLDGEKLKTEDIDYIIRLNPEPNTAWQRIKEKVWQRLTTHLLEMRGLVSHWVNSGVCSEPSISQKAETTTNSPKFHSQAFFTFEGRDIQTEEVIGSTKKEATQKAIGLAVLKAMDRSDLAPQLIENGKLGLSDSAKRNSQNVEIALPSSWENLQAPISPKNAKEISTWLTATLPIPFPNFKGLLLEEINTRGLTNPKFLTYRAGGKDNAPIFQCTVTVRVNGKSDNSTAFGRSARESEHVAAMVALSKVKASDTQRTTALPNNPNSNETVMAFPVWWNEINLEVESDRSKIISWVNEHKEIFQSNHKGALLEFCQKNRLQSPNFEIQSAGSDHVKVFQTTCALEVAEQKFHAVGYGRNIKQAEALACLGMVKQISSARKSINPHSHE